MKQLFTLLAFGFFALSASAQGNQINSSEVPKRLGQELKVSTPERAKKSSNPSSASRATTANFTIAYRDNEILYAEDKSYGTSGFGWNVNARFPNESVFSLRNIAVLFDTLVENTDNFQSFKTKFYPKSESTIKINAVYLPLAYDKNVNKNDTFKISIFKLPASYTWNSNTLGGLVAGTGVNETLVTEPTTIWADSTFNFVVSDYALDSNTNSSPTIYFVGRDNLNLQLNKGETFGVRIDFTSDTLNSLRILAGAYEKCQDSAFSNTAIYPNSVGYMNFKISPTVNLSSVMRDNIGYNNTPACNRFDFQNITFYADVEVTNDNFGIVAVPSITEGCPGSQVDLKANFFGSSEATFQWSAKQGVLSSTTDEEVTLTLPNSVRNDTVTLIGTDSTGTQKDTSVIIIRNNGIAINFANSPYSINCGARATAVSALTGFTAGQRVFQWDIDSDPLVDTTTSSGNLGGLLPGSYSVTVTNSRGCQASTNFSVQYNNGVTNTVNFTTPDVITGGAAQVCINVPYTYTNTSSNKDGWNSNWSFGDANGSTDNSENAFFAYTATGTFRINLSMDSAGCRFNGPEKSVQVLPATNAACNSIGINEISFEQSVELIPNPNNGLVTVNVSNIEKGISIQVFNILGSEVKQFTSKDANGTFSKSFDYSDLSKGAYLVKIQSGSKVAVKRMIVNK